MNHTIKMFLKFGSLENIQDLYNNGTVYINTVEYFRKLEDQNLRGDSYEGATKVINSLPGTFRIKDIDRDFKYEKVHLKQSYEGVKGNLYCLYAISSHGFKNPLDFKIDELNTGFGTHCLMVKDNLYFIESIENKLREEGFQYVHGFVDYYDKETVCKELTLFDKPNEYEYQKEFRFYVFNEINQPIKIQIGSLHGKAEIVEMKDILTMRLEQKTNAIHTVGGNPTY